MNNYIRQEGESYDDFFVRVGNAAANREITWNTATDILNRDTGHNYNEATYRKRHTNFSDGMRYQQALAEKAMPNDVVTSIRNERALLEMEKIKWRDERNEVSRLNREMARTSSLKELIERCVKSYDPMIPNTADVNVDNGNAAAEHNEVIVHLTDLHVGIEVCSVFNYYDKDVAYRRLAKYLLRIKDIVQRHGSSAIRLVLGGDIISGIIHTNIRLENNENVVKQTMDAAEMCSWFASELAALVPAVYVYSTAGNHGRVFQNKEHNEHGENFDNFIPFYMKARLQNFSNVMVVDDNIDDSIASFVCCDCNVVAVHGDKDSRESVVQRMTMLLGYKPDLVLMGHRHTNGMTTVYDTKVIESGCLSGPDGYCMDKRLRNKPEQTVVVFNRDGVECLYDIRFD